MKGQIIKILSDTHFVVGDDNRDVIPCKCRGRFRNQGIIPMVGDFVRIDLEQQLIVEVLRRKNALTRPPVANIDQGVIVTSVIQPNFSFYLLDKLISMMELVKVKPVICLTKMDLVNEDDQMQIRSNLRYYQTLGYEVLENTQIETMKEIFSGKTTVFTGQTGAGKSTLLNKLDETLHLETGEISLALGRGRHTTRCSRLIPLFDGKVLDTPGFSALTFHDFTKEEIRDSFIEFRDFTCKYQDCMHLKEEDCMVKHAVLTGKILESRYQNYQKFVEEGRSSR